MNESELNVWNFFQPIPIFLGLQNLSTVAATILKVFLLEEVCLQSAFDINVHGFTVTMLLTNISQATIDILLQNLHFSVSHKLILDE